MRHDHLVLIARARWRVAFVLSKPTKGIVREPAQRSFVFRNGRFREHPPTSLGSAPTPNFGPKHHR